MASSSSTASPAFFAAAKSGVLPLFEAHIFLGIICASIAFILLQCLALGAVLIGTNNRIARAKQSEYMILSAFGIVMMLAAQAFNAYFFPMDTWPQRYPGFFNYWLWMMGITIYVVPGIARVWRVICFHSTTVSIDFQKKCPPVHVHLTRVTDMKIRAHQWMIVRITILAVPWISCHFLTFGLSYTGWSNYTVFSQSIEYIYTGLVVVTGVWMAIVKKMIIIKEIMEWKSLLLYSIIFAVFFITNNSMWYWVMPLGGNIIRYYMIVIILFMNVAVIATVGWTLLLSVKYLITTMKQSKKAKEQLEEAEMKEVLPKAELTSRKSFAKSDPPASAAPQEAKKGDNLKEGATVAELETATTAQTPTIASETVSPTEEVTNV